MVAIIRHKARQISSKVFKKRLGALLEPKPGGMREMWKDMRQLVQEQQKTDTRVENKSA